MIGINQDQLIISIFKLLEIIFFTIAAIRVKKIKNYALNHLISFGFFGWAAFLALDILVMVFGGLSQEIFEIMGYVWFAQMILTVMNAYIFLVAVLIIKHGESILKSNFVYFGFIVAAIVGSLLGLNLHIKIVDEVGIQIPPENLPYAGRFQIVQDLTPLGIIIYLIPLLTYIYSIINLAQTRSHIEEKEVRDKMLLMLIGLALIPIGFTYFVLLSLVLNNILLYHRMIGHIFWLSAPIFLYKSQTKKK